MKTRVVLIVTILLTGAAAWYFFLRTPAATTLVERLIPSTSIGVLSLNNPEEIISSLSEYDWWDEMAALPLFTSGIEVLTAIDSLGIKSDLGNLPTYVSFHITGNDQLETLFLFNASDFQWQPAAIETMLDRLYGESNVDVSQRNYLGRTIFEARAGNASMGFFIEGDYLALSANVLLVEDVVRAVEQEGSLMAAQNFDVENPKTAISLLLDCSKLEDLTGVFSEKSAEVGISGNLLVRFDLELLPSGLSLYGSSVYAEGVETGAEVNLRLKNFMPVTASLVKWFAIDSSVESKPQDLGALNLSEFLSLHIGDLCLLDLDLNNQETDRVLMASTSDGEAVQAQLLSLANEMMVQNDTLFRESFMDAEIIFINKSELPKALYGESISGFDQTYFSTYNDVLIFGSSIDAVKSVLSEYDAENTWGRSIERRRYVDNLVQEANYTAIYNFEYLLESVRDDFKPAWEDFFESRAALLNALDLFSIQISDTGNGLLVNAALTFNESTDRVYTQVVATGAPAEERVALEPKVNVFADTTLRTRSFVTRNHNNNAREMIFQDAGNQLYLTNDQGVVLWKKALDEPVRGNISQIDYYNNRKLQFFFFTQTAMHLVDRNGDDVEGFPKQLGTDLPLDGHRVVDYDNTRRYRYAAADRRGKVYLYSKEGAVLDGWNPKIIGSQLLDIPEHVRIRGRDCFLMIETNGIIHLTNRRGDYYPGFPYNSNKRLAGDAVIAKGSDFSKSRIITMAENGELVSLDFNGKAAERNQILRPNARSRFQLVKDRLNNGFAIGRRDASQIVIFDSSGEELFSVPVADGDQLDLSFYNFRNDSEVFVLWNQTANKVDVFDKKGRSIINQPLATNASIGIIYYQSKAEYELFVNFANQMAVYTVRK